MVGVGQKGFCLDTHPRIISDSSTHPYVGHGNEEKTIGDMKLLNQDITSNNNNPIHHEVGFVGGVAGDEVRVVASDSAWRKKGGGVVEKTITMGGNGGRKKSGGERRKDEDKGKLHYETLNCKRHTLTERENRNKMIKMFSDLHGLLPQLPPKTPKHSIIKEAINYIKNLEETLQNLQREKLKRLFNTSTNTTIATLIPSRKLALDNDKPFQGNEGSSTKRSGTIPCPTSIVFSPPQSFPIFSQTWTSSNVTLHMFGKDAHISVCSSKKPALFTMICFILEKYKLEFISASISSDDTKSMYAIHARAEVPDHFAESFPVEETYKKVMIEIAHLVSS